MMIIIAINNNNRMKQNNKQEIIIIKIHWHHKNLMKFPKRVNLLLQILLKRLVIQGLQKKMKMKKKNNKKKKNNQKIKKKNKMLKKKVKLLMNNSLKLEQINQVKNIFMMIRQLIQQNKIKAKLNFSKQWKDK